MPTTVRMNRQGPEASDAYRALCCSARDPASLSEAEVDALKSYCFQLVRNWSTEAFRERQRERSRIARGYQTRLFESLASRLVAAWLADRKFGRRQRRKWRLQGRAAAYCPASFVSVWRIAERLRNVHAPASVIIHAEPKDKGGSRLICSPDRFGIAKQMLFVNAVKPFASFHHAQFAVKRRGRLAACKNLLETMNDPSMCNTRFIQFDVADFFGSISREYVEEIVPAPKAIIRSTLFMENWRVTVEGVCTMPDRRGLSQGLAASSLVAEMVMANVLGDIANLFPELDGLHAYSDNWGGFVSHDRDLGELVDEVRRAFEAHPAGPYRLTDDEIRPVGQPFKFLGFYFKPSSEGRRARISVPRRLLESKELEFTGQLIAADTGQEVLKVVHQLMSFCSAYRLAPETRKLGSRIGRLIIGDLDFRMKRAQQDLSA